MYFKIAKKDYIDKQQNIWIISEIYGILHFGPNFNWEFYSDTVLVRQNSNWFCNN